MCHVCVVAHGPVKLSQRGVGKSTSGFNLKYLGAVFSVVHAFDLGQPVVSIQCP